MAMCYRSTSDTTCLGSFFFAFLQVNSVERRDLDAPLPTCAIPSHAVMVRHIPAYGHDPTQRCDKAMTPLTVLARPQGVSVSQHRFLDLSSYVHPSLTYRRGLAASRVPPAPPSELSRLQPNAQNANAKTPQQTFRTPNDARKVAICVCSLAVDPSCQLLGCGTSHGCVLVYELRSNKQRALVDVCRPAITGLAFAPGGKYLIARCAQGWVWLLDSLSGFRR